MSYRPAPGGLDPGFRTARVYNSPMRASDTCQLKDAKLSILSLAVRDDPSAAGDSQLLHLIPQIDRRRTDRHHFAVVVASEHVIEYRPRIVFAVIGLCQDGHYRPCFDGIGSLSCRHCFPVSAPESVDKSEPPCAVPPRLGKYRIK